MILGIGVDVLSIARVARRLAEDPGWPLAVFGSEELAARGGRPAVVAAGFVAKEAILKVLGVEAEDGVLFHEVELLGGPIHTVVRLSGRALVAGRRAGIRKIHVCVTEAEGKAVAVAVAEGETEGGA